MCNVRHVGPGVCRRAGLLSIPEAGERLRGAVKGVGCGGLLDRMHTERRSSVAWGGGLTLVRAPSRATTVPPARMAPAQHGSTATHPDAGALVGMWEDGDLHGWTRVDVLPPDGMQEVRSSNLLSSTGQKQNSNRSNSEYSSKVQQLRPDGPPYVCSDQTSSTM